MVFTGFTTNFNILGIMAVIIGREKKKQRRVERADVMNGLKEARIAAAKKKEELKAAAEEEAIRQEAAKAEKKRGRKPLVMKPAAEPAEESTGVVADAESDNTEKE